MKKLKLDELNRLSIDAYKKSPKIPLVLVLDNIRSRQNVGSLFRTADALGIKSILLCGITPTPPHRDIHKAALGATESVDWNYVNSIVEAVHSLKNEGFKVIGLEQTNNSTLLTELIIKKEEKIALIVGNEVNGISDAALNLLDEALEIEQFGTKHSFNVSIASGIALWQMSTLMR